MLTPKTAWLIPLAQHSFQVLLSLSCILVGFASIWQGDILSALWNDHDFYTFNLVIWSMGFIFGGVTGIYGLYITNPRIESVGMFLIFFSIMLLTFMTWTQVNITSDIVRVFIALGFLLRGWYLRKLLKEMCLEETSGGEEEK